MNGSRGCSIVKILALTLLAACVQVVQRPPEEPPPPTPDPYLAAGPGELVATDHPGLFQAPELGRTCYTYEPKREWYRFAYNHWYQAFRWDGDWYLVPDAQVPKFLAGRVPKEPVRSKADKLDELERQLEEIDRKEREERERLRRQREGDPAPPGQATTPTGAEEPE